VRKRGRKQEERTRGRAREREKEKERKEKEKGEIEKGNLFCKLESNKGKKLMSPKVKSHYTCYHKLNFIHHHCYKHRHKHEVNNSYRHMRGHRMLILFAPR
jgi:hypothetical protein